MGLFSSSKKRGTTPIKLDQGVVAIQNQLQNLDLLYISDLPASRIPRFGQGIVIEISFKDGIPFIQENERLDPSTIFRSLPISEPSSFGDVESLPYWPSYAGMNPQQRFVYLTWLRDVSSEIDMGYVFIYYYGLERQLLFGHFERAFHEIIKLRKYHKNKSFQKYSENALIFSCFYNKRLDLLLEDYGEASLNRFSNIQLEFAVKSDINLSSQNVISLFKEMKLYKAAINGYEILFEKCVLKSLQTTYEEDFFPFGKSFSLTDVKGVKEQAFANYSFPDELRYPEVKNIINSKKFIKEVSKLFNIAYDDLKKEKAILRKAQKENMTEDEKVELRYKREKARLKKLYDSNVLKKDEYELLLRNLEGKNNT